MQRIYNIYIYMKTTASPFLIPLERKKISVGVPFIMIHNEEVLRLEKISLNIFFGRETKDIQHFICKRPL